MKTPTRVIWKFPLALAERQCIKLPRGAELLDVQVQDGVACLWAIVFPENDPVPVNLRIIGTGNPFELSKHSLYVGTFQTPPFVWHLFQEP